VITPVDKSKQATHIVQRLKGSAKTAAHTVPQTDLMKNTDVDGTNQGLPSAVAEGVMILITKLNNSGYRSDNALHTMTAIKEFVEMNQGTKSMMTYTTEFEAKYSKSLRLGIIFPDKALAMMMLCKSSLDPGEYSKVLGVVTEGNMNLLRMAKGLNYLLLKRDTDNAHTHHQQ
jgi:hypothetical protein